MQPRKNNFFIFYITIAILVVAVIAGFIFYWFLWRATQKGTDAQQFTVQIGDSNSEVAQSLKKQGFIKSTIGFGLAHAIEGDKKIQNGGFLISKSMSVSHLRV